MTEREKAQKGYLYDANYDQQIIEERTRCADLCYEFNQCRPSDTKKQKELLTKILGSMKENPVITAPFYCDYGFNISIGKMERRLRLEIMYSLLLTVYFLQPGMQ